MFPNRSKRVRPKKKYSNMKCSSRQKFTQYFFLTPLKDLPHITLYIYIYIYSLCSHFSWRWANKCCWQHKFYDLCPSYRLLHDCTNSSRRKFCILSSTLPQLHTITTTLKPPGIFKKLILKAFFSHFGAFYSMFVLFKFSISLAKRQNLQARRFFFFFLALPSLMEDELFLLHEVE